MTDDGDKAMLDDIRRMLAESSRERKANEKKSSKGKSPFAPPVGYKSKPLNATRKGTTNS
jgi:hypothetical protein